MDSPFIQKIRELAENKTTSEMISRKISSMINEDLKTNNILDKNKKPIKISHVTACSYLNYIRKTKKNKESIQFNKRSNEEKG